MPPWLTSIRQALWDHAALAEDKGTIRLTDATDDAVAAKVTKLEVSGWRPPSRIAVRRTER